MRKHTATPGCTIYTVSSEEQSTRSNHQDTFQAVTLSTKKCTAITYYTSRKENALSLSLSRLVK